LRPHGQRDARGGDTGANGGLISTSLLFASFVFIPFSTFFLGLWIIRKTIGHKAKISLIAIALLVGLIIFEGSVIGMIIDPRFQVDRLTYVIGQSLLIGFITAIIVFVFTKLFNHVVRVINKIENRD
jgi:hypothetical protein